MSIDSQRCQSIVVNNVHWYALFQGYCSGNVLFPFYCPGCKHIIPHLSHDANGPLPKISKSIVADNVYRQTAWPVYCGRQWPLTRTSSGPLCSSNDLSLIRTGCSRSGITNTEYQPQHNRQCNTLNPHDAHCLVVETYNVEAPPHAILVPCTYCCSSRYIMHSFHTDVITIENKDDQHPKK